MPPLPLVLLPGLDGTGWLLRDFVDALGPTVAPRVVAYPTHEVRTYVGLEPIVEASLPGDAPFAIVAESFGGPLALRIAAKRPPGLVAVVLVATFARAPVPAWMSRLRGLLGATFFSVPPPTPLVRALMTGWGADDALVAAFRASVTAVHPAVLAARVRAVLEVDEAAAFVDCPVPVLYLRAERDALLRKGIAEELQALRPELAIASLPAPHLVLQTHAREAAEIVTSFLGSEALLR
jgi:pimeloyl-ACP methyl ester carboxylesterase